MPPRSFRESEDAGGNVVNRVLPHLAAAVGAKRPPDSRVEQTQEIVDLGRRGDGRAGIAGGVLLANRYGRRDAPYFVDIGFFHALEELPRIGRQRLHVAALAFGVDRVEDERGFPRTRNSGYDDQLVVG